MPLYVVATPIGNLLDLTARAREVLASCDAVVAEDTRHTGQLLKHLGIEKKPFHALPAYDEAGRADAILRRLAEGASLALVTDAGTPGISDPGALLVRRAVEQGHPVVACTADLQYSNGLIGFARRYPERLIQFGISEQNMVSAAAGLAASCSR